MTHKISPLLEDGAGKLTLAVTISGIAGEIKICLFWLVSKLFSRENLEILSKLEFEIEIVALVNHNSGKYAIVLHF